MAYMDPIDTAASRQRDEPEKIIMYRPSRLHRDDIYVVLDDLTAALDEQLFRLRLTEATKNTSNTIELWFLSKIANHQHFGCWSKRVRDETVTGVLLDPVIRDFLLNVTATVLLRWGVPTTGQSLLHELIRWVAGGSTLNGADSARTALNPEAAASIRVDYSELCLFLEANAWFLVYYMIVQHPSCLQRYKDAKANIATQDQPSGAPA